MGEIGSLTSRHVVAVVGAATAGSEIAHILARRGASVIVFDQNARPYGKIEDGLPRWHVKQRRDEYEEINKRTVELRYRLLPYVYNEMYKASMTGIPPMRPLAFEYPEDPRYSTNSTEFMFGDDLLVAPVLWSGDRSRSLRLPEGQWYDYWSAKRLKGGSQVTVEAPLDRIPVFVKAGSIIPTQQVLQYSDQAPIDPLTLSIYVGQDGS
jgi:alpha-glucosidase (family GH31 glycosyl hydrolase)